MITTKPSREFTLLIVYQDGLKHDSSIAQLQNIQSKMHENDPQMYFLNAYIFLNTLFPRVQNGNLIESFLKKKKEIDRTLSATATSILNMRQNLAQSHERTFHLLSITQAKIIDEKLVEVCKGFKKNKIVINFK